MPMRIIKTAYTKIGEYHDTSGQLKGRYLNIGKLFKRDDGSVSLKIDAIPTGGWDGWVNFSDPQQKEAPADSPSGTHAPAARYQASARTQAPAAPAQPDFNDEIPF